MKAETRKNLRSILKAIAGQTIGWIIGMVIFFSIINWKEQKEAERIREQAEESSKQMAVNELCELKGRVREIKRINVIYGDMPEMQETLRAEIEYISEFSSEHKLLEEFEITVENNSEISEICDEIISQIEDQRWSVLYD